MVPTRAGIRGELPLLDTFRLIDTLIGQPIIDLLNSVLKNCGAK